MAFRPARSADVERHTGRRPPAGTKVWRLEVGGRFLRSGGLVYPGGVPYPDELRSETAVVSSEVWLYVTEDSGEVLGLHSWPEAVRKPIAAVVADDLDADEVVHPSEAASRLGWDVPLPTDRRWEPFGVFADGPREAVVWCVRSLPPEPFNEMVLYAEEGLTLRVRREAEPQDLERVLESQQPPFRPVAIGRRRGIGREPGKSLGPQTWPWPGELWWSADGADFELRGLHPLSTLVEVAGTIRAAEAG